MQINEDTIRPDWNKPKYVDDKIDLSNNLCYDTIVNESISNLIKTLDVSFRQYTDEYPLYVAISNHHDIDIKNLVCGYGLGELIDRILRVYKNLKFAIVSPTWPMVEIFCSLHSIPFERISSHKQETNCQAIYIANPNGITGECFSKKELEDLLNRYELVVIDEAYGEFSNIDYSFFKEAKYRENLLVLKTLSKSLGVAGLRIGYGVANFEIINKLQMVRPSCTSHSISVDLSPYLFDMIPGHVSRMIETRTWLEQNYDCIPSQGNFVLFRTLPKGIDEKFYTKNIKGIHRMSLTNLQIIKNAISN
jgi:histidinol-phosphate/aromatic aminotransferase/cobyric acid decarboxylase-like protein